ncbi:hypothetical protein RND71_011547 [Anisodus tanguticus]|uniref:Uncharacterized protein n=1 Tax=Anisodus tanguticus TaxID=243964 RepID=A0AAE1SCY6_9SOLA|nr:hypothetical protein RND71_011547 [Anisodus tanguticus]
MKTVRASQLYQLRTYVLILNNNYVISSLQVLFFHSLIEEPKITKFFNTKNLR